MSIRRVNSTTKLFSEPTKPTILKVLAFLQAETLAERNTGVPYFFSSHTIFGNLHLENDISGKKWPRWMLDNIRTSCTPRHIQLPRKGRKRKFQKKKTFTSWEKNTTKRTPFSLKVAQDTNQPVDESRLPLHLPKHIILGRGGMGSVGSALPNEALVGSLGRALRLYSFYRRRNGPPPPPTNFPPRLSLGISFLVEYAGQ